MCSKTEKYKTADDKVVEVGSIVVNLLKKYLYAMRTPAVDRNATICASTK